MILPTGTLIISNTRTFTSLLPSTGNKHFVKCHSCEAIEAHYTEDILRNKIDHTCSHKDDVHDLLKPHINSEMIEIELWSESELWSGYSVSSIGRIMNTNGEYLLAPSKVSRSGRAYYRIKGVTVSNLDLVQEYLERIKGD